MAAPAVAAVMVRLAVAATLQVLLQVKAMVAVLQQVAALARAEVAQGQWVLLLPQVSRGETAEQDRLQVLPDQLYFMPAVAVAEHAATLFLVQVE
jgi:hypothetical protein